jgi:MSHA biogenesis protein MshN
MSIINQVLNELEKRGANPSMGEVAIRAVPPRRQRHALHFAIIMVLSLFLLAVGKWYFDRDVRSPERPVLAMMPASAVSPATSIQVSSVVPAPAASAVSVSNAQDASQTSGGLHGKPLLVVKSDQEPVVIPEPKKPARSEPQHAKVTAESANSPDEGNPELLKKVSPQQRAESEFRKANFAMQEGRTNDALAGYESALLADPTYKAARRAWAGLLVGIKRNDEAEKVLQRGLKRDSHDAFFAMSIARLQVERDAVPLALETLEKTLPYAKDQADYQSFVAALLQRLGRHEEAVAHYQICLKQLPTNGVWWIGMGISLQALEHKGEARDAYQHALTTNTLNAQLQGYVQQKLKDL